MLRIAHTFLIKLDLPEPVGPIISVLSPLRTAATTFSVFSFGQIYRGSNFGMKQRTSSGQSSGWNTLKACSRSEEHTSELQSQSNLVCRLLLEKTIHRAAPAGRGAVVVGATRGPPAGHTA